MEGNSICSAAYSFSQSKNTKQNGDIFFTPMLSKERKESHLKGTSQNAQEGYNYHPRKEKNATKIKKNVNKLFKTLYPNEAQMEGREGKEYHYQGRNMECVHGKQETQVNSRSYDGVGAASYSAVPRGSHDEGVRNSQRKGGFPSGNVLNRELPSSYPDGQRGETTLQSVSNVGGNDSSSDSSSDSGGGRTGEHHSGENIERSQKSAANQQSALHLFGKSEKLKSESKFALMDYLKDFFQKSTYMKKFQNFIEIFFNKYDQRVLESTIFFNFDETLF
ncbi:hypothetical protein PCYB_083430 [Plasmodium cynomolgi strain B]|uniref:Uncharacterized protein n=1 Tax=Plasmodium cynomolgi (strain B) TaxID=1120755 RepID=K6VAH6_PLACD|nr:hypothetical protein PCYB_083430 [Plasmodium cynomolgi strain B]GAB66182.1 hypothetical protein PCYB_083430 [Plasmodium cynomolgi strain B]